MGANPEEIEEAESPPPPPGTNKVEITVAGHTVIIESPEALSEVIGYTMGIYEQTRDAATRIPFGFDTGAGHHERAEPYTEADNLQGWEDDNARRVERNQRHRP